MDTVVPRLSILREEHIQQIHRHSLDILERTGIRVQSARALGLFARSGGANVDEEVVHLSSELVQWALEVTPSEVTIFTRRGDPAFTLGNPEEGTRYGIGVTNLHYQNPVDKSILPFSREHIAVAARIGSQLSSFDVISTPGLPRELTPDVVESITALEMIANSVMPLVILVPEGPAFKRVLDLLQHLHGDLDLRPFVIPYVNPITPLIINHETVEKLWMSIQTGLPVVYSNYGMYGATTPITHEGSLLLLNAELLAGIVLSQLMKEGTPVIAGSLPASFDMQQMSSVYTPQSFLLNLTCAEMMAFYGIPHCGTSGSGRGWGADLPAAGDFWMNHLSSCLGKVGLAPFVGGNFDSLVFSPASVVYADQVIQASRAVAKGYTLDSNSGVLDEIDQAGPGGNFLMAESTLEKISGSARQESLWPAYSLESWKTAGSPDAHKLFRTHVIDFLQTLEPPEDHDDLIRKGENFIKRGSRFESLQGRRRSAGRF